MTFGNIAPKQLSDGNSQGTVLGESSSDKISFYNVTPTAQRTNPNQAVAATTIGGAEVLSVQTVTLTPSSVAPAETASQAITVTGTPTLSTDFIVYNKITAQAGLGVVNARGGTTANTIILNYANLTSATITPTSEASTYVALRNIASTVTLSPNAVPPNTTEEQIFTVTGISPGMLVAVQKPTDQAGIGVVNARVAGNNQLAITFINTTSATVTPTASESYSYIALQGLSPDANTFILGADVGTLAAVSNATCSEQGVTVTGGPLVNDLVVGVSKPTAQSGLGIAGARVSAANILGITFINPTAATVTPTASEVYAVTLWRAAPAAVLTLYSVTFAPAAVAPNTTAEQALTVTAVTASQVTWVNKPSLTTGIGVVGTRVSAAGVVGITFANATATTITPPSETYLIGAFTSYPSAGSYLAWQTRANNTVRLANEMRTSLVNLGLIAGQ